MVADTVIDHTDIRRKIVAAGTAFGTVKEQGFSYIRKASALESPVGDGEMFFLGIHIIDILRIIYAVDEFQQASKLTGLQYDIPHISAVADPGKFSCESVGSVHNYCCHSHHSVYSFASRLALQQTGKKLSGIIRHASSPLCTFRFIICMRRTICDSGGVDVSLYEMYGL